MSIQTATPYLNLNGRAREAIALYTRVLGARTESLSRFGDVDGSCPAASKDRVMHCALRIGEALLMLSDGPDGKTVPPTGAVSVALDFDDEAQLRACFDAFAATGTTIAPVFPMPWGGTFGAVIDKLGIAWMLHFHAAGSGGASSTST